MNRPEDNSRERLERLKDLIQRLHSGAPFEEVRQDFARHFSDVSPAEISKMEQELVANGLPVMDIQRLCDVHAAVFKGSIAEIHQPAADLPGHPVNIFHLENRKLEQVLAGSVPALLSALEKDDSPPVGEIDELITALWEIDRHYSRKENLLFPYLEQSGVTAPPKVMWGVDDEIRAKIKKLRQVIAGSPAASNRQIATLLEDVRDSIQEMIFKEEKILFPMSLEKLANSNWVTIARESGEIGYTLLDQEDIPLWPVEETASLPDDHASDIKGEIKLSTGYLQVAELENLLNALPFDITFVGSDDRVRYFSQGKDRIFARTKTVIGRQVSHCHPPASVAQVEKILDDFRSGKRDEADFWLRQGERFVLIRYFAVRDSAGQYLGTLEVTQDIAPIQEIKGEKRLLDQE